MNWKKTNKIEVISLFLHEIKNDTLRKYAVNLKGLENYQLVINLEKHVTDLEILLIVTVISIASPKVMMQKIVFSMVIFIKPIILNSME